MGKNKTGNNPWINVTAPDYEGHMDSPNVGQLKFLNNLFKNVLSEYKPAALAVPGCTTGNGFEHIDFTITKKVLAIDINPGYLQILRDRFSDKLGEIETVCADLDNLEFKNRKFDLVHCALIFEYVDVPKLVGKISGILRKNGKLSVLLQLPHENSPEVSKTDFKSIKYLSGFIKLVPTEEFNEIAVACGLLGESENLFTLDSGKTFWSGVYKKT